MDFYQDSLMRRQWRMKGRAHDPNHTKSSQTQQRQIFGMV